MIYRITRRSTRSLQGDSSTWWNRETLYCGVDVTEARVAYHGSEPHDEYRGHGNCVTETLWEVLDDDELDDSEEGTFEIADPA